MKRILPMFAPASATRSRRGLLPLGFGAAALALALASPAKAAGDLTQNEISVGSGVQKSIQMGLGRSVIVDLPEDAAEIFVGEPKVANAIVRSARRLYVSTLSAGATTIFALAADGR